MTSLKALLFLLALSIVGFYYSRYRFKMIKYEDKKMIRCSVDTPFSCEENQTCCRAQAGWRCCPGKNAVCCSDGLSCCNEGDECNLENNGCIVKRSDQNYSHHHENLDL